jgi:hypothetical protein
MSDMRSAEASEANSNEDANTAASTPAARNAP